MVPLGTAATVVPLPERQECAFVQPSRALPLFLRHSYPGRNILPVECQSPKPKGNVWFQTFC